MYVRPDRVNEGLMGIRHALWLNYLLQETFLYSHLYQQSNQCRYFAYVSTMNDSVFPLF